MTLSKSQWHGDLPPTPQKKFFIYGRMDRMGWNGWNNSGWGNNGWIQPGTWLHNECHQRKWLGPDGQLQAAVAAQNAVGTEYVAMTCNGQR